MSPRAFAFLLLLLPVSSAVALDDVTEMHGVTVKVIGLEKETRTDVMDVVKQQLALAEDDHATAPLADDLAFFVLQTYRQSGRDEAKVGWDIKDSAIELLVDGGRLFTIGKIIFEGNESQKEEELRKYLLRPTQERYGKQLKMAFVSADLIRGAALVQRFLESQGWLDAQVEEPEVRIGSEEGTRDVVVRIHEGQRYVFGEVKADGDLLDEEAAVRELLDGLTGEPFSEVKVESVRGQVAAVFQHRGYMDAKVVAEAEASAHKNGTVPVTYSVTPGGLRRISKVEISPEFSAGARRLVSSNFNLALGRIYKPGDIEILHRKTLDTEVFSRLNVETEPEGDDALALKLSGAEGPTKRLSVYAGYETFQGAIIGFEARQLNIFNTGDAVQLKAELNGIGWKGGLKVIDPAIFNTANLLDLEYKAEAITFFGIDELSSGVRATLRRPWSTHLTTNAYAEFSHHSLSEDLVLPDELGPTNYDVATGGISAVLDYRNNPLVTTKGWITGATVEVGTSMLGGNVSYLKTDIFFSFYQPLTKKLRMSFNARTRSIDGSDGLQKLPLDLRLFNGGGTTVRSFPEQEMELSSENFGGSLTQTFNLEVSYEVISNLEIAAFVDAGNVRRDSANPFASPKELRYAAGLGIRYKLPFGPLRIDYGYNLDRKQGEDIGALHITFGFPF